MTNQAIVPAGAAYLPLSARGILTIAGPDARSFLQGLISNDIDKVSSSRAIYAALLTPQGKFLHDFLIAASGETLLFDCEADRLADLGGRLARYRLRAVLTLADASEDYAVYAIIGEAAAHSLGLAAEPGATTPFAGGVVFCDPRHGALGCRAILPSAGGAAPLIARGLSETTFLAYERLRIGLGVPDGSRDITVEQATLVESNFEALNGVDFKKGCYVGQELTARTKYRGLVKRRLMRVALDGPLPAPGTPILAGDKTVGELRSGVPGLALALLRLDHGGGSDAPLMAGLTRLTPLP
jgi:hypothetical protein